MPGKLYYFDLYGRAEGIRAMLGHANFDYEDTRLTVEEFGAKKAEGFLPLGSAPVWEEDGEVYCQSSCILRFLGIRLGYYSDDPMKIWAIDSIVDFMEDNQGNYAGYLAPVLGGAQVEESGGSAWLSGFWDKVIPIIEARLAEHGMAFIAGTERPTIADFKAFQPLLGSLHNPASAVPQSVRDRLQEKIDASPGYKRWVETMLRECQAYMASRQPRPL